MNKFKITNSFNAFVAFRFFLCLLLALVITNFAQAIGPKLVSDQFTLRSFAARSSSGLDDSWSSWEIYDKKGNRFVFRMHLPKSENISSASLIVYLDGSGTNGRDNSRQMAYPDFIGLFSGADALNAVVIVPQCAIGDSWDSLEWSGDAPPQASQAPASLMVLLVNLVQSLQKNYAIAPARSLIWGFSQGAFGTLDALVHFPTVFGAFISLGGGNDPQAIAQALNSQRLWLFHGAHDNNVNPEHSKRLARAVQAAGKTCRLTIYPDADHPIMHSVLHDKNFIDFLRKY